MIHALEPRLIQAACPAHPGRFIERCGLGLYAANKEKHRFLFCLKPTNGAKGHLPWGEYCNPETDLNQGSFECNHFSQKFCCRCGFIRTTGAQQLEPAAEAAPTCSPEKHAPGPKTKMGDTRTILCPLFFRDKMAREGLLESKTRIGYGEKRKELHMKQIREAVYFIPGQDEMIPDAHVYLIGTPDSEDVTLVDAGLTGKGAYKIEAIQGLGFPLGSIGRVIMTHTHFDHIGCLGEILKAIPQAELWVHPAEGDLLEQGDDRAVYGMDMFKSMCQAQYGIQPGAFTFQVHRRLEDGDILDLGDTRWEVLHIPGHSAGSIGLYSPRDKILIPGDTVYADYAIGRFDLYGANGPQLKASLLRLADLDVEILLPGHNRIVEAAPAGYIRETANQWGPYLE